MSRDEAFKIANELKKKLKEEGPSYESLTVKQDSHGDFSVVVGPNKWSPPKPRPRASDAVKNWPSSWTLDYLVGEPVEVKVWERDDDWSRPMIWKVGIVSEINAFTHCITVLCGETKYYATGEGYIRRVAKKPLASDAVPDQSAKQDIGKIDWGLLIPTLRRSLEAVIAVRAFGETRYGTSESWKTVDPVRYKKAAMRHIVESLSGATKNEADGGCYHLAQAVCDALFALELELAKEGQKK